MTTTTTTTTTSVPLAYEEVGGGDPVMFIPGISLNRYVWGQNIPAFAGFRCIAVDNRDSGESPRVDGPYSVGDMAEDTLALIERLGLPPVHLVGHSLGGAIAQEVCLRAPERVRSLVLVNTWARNDNYTSGLLELWKTFADRMTDPYDFLRSLLFFGVGRSAIEAVGVDALVQAFASAPNPQTPDAFKRQVDAGLGVDTLDRLGQIRTPVLVVTGDEDTLFPPKHARQILSAIPHAQRAQIRGTGHSPLVENPSELNEAVLRFLRPR